MATDVIMPQMGESIAEGTITKWLKKVGDSVQRDEPIFEISTDKVDAEIPSPVAGTLLEIKVPEGQTVAINTVVARIGEAGEQPTASPAPAARAPEPPKAAEQPKPAPAPPPPPARPAEAAAPAPPAPPRAAPPPPPPRPPAAPPPAPAPVSAKGGTIESFEERVRTRSSPLVRKIAQENGVDIREIEGTGIHSRVTKNDILSFIENRPARVAAAGGAQAAAARPATAPEPARPALPVTDRDEVVAMTKIRKITAENMILSKRTSAHVTTVFQIDYTNVARLRDQSKDAFLQKNGVKLTYLPFIFRACVQALKEFPQVNASIDGDNIVYHKDVHLG
ncbi:MAG TPA: dihydrolipoamide acetyltransferase family protein, partial [Thermoanaerobaculia bacterium]|nr:dihydrolipoamide acetyltransferase family protein [Thermoanaerobaculia bacterium]